MVEYYVRRKGMTVAEAGTRLSPSLAQTPEAAQARLGDSGRGGWAANVRLASRTPCAAGCPAGPPGRSLLALTAVIKA